jgi:hypothetical protein
LVDDEPFEPEEAEFFLESATSKGMGMLEEGGYDPPGWEEKDGGKRKAERLIQMAITCEFWGC